MRKIIQSILIIGLCFLKLPSDLAWAAPKPEEGTQLKLPPIWAAASPQARLVALRISELDATRLLAERVYGLQISEESNVRDLAQIDDRVNGAITQFVKGVTTTEGPTYYDDGRVEVVRAVKIKKLVEVIREVFRVSQGKEIKLSSEVENRSESEVLDALGNAALPGSAGHMKILAKRAAELDAYRRLAERALGVQISSEADVGNFAAKSDRIKASLAATLKNAEPTRIVYQPDNSCSVSMKLAVGPLMRTVKKEIGVTGSEIVDSKTVQTVIEETGQGVPPSNTNASSSAPASSSITETEIQRIVDQAMESN
jgi:hypothetical protein